MQLPRPHHIQKRAAIKIVKPAHAGAMLALLLTDAHIDDVVDGTDRARKCTAEIAQPLHAT